MGTLREALTTRVPGLKVVIARNECMLERQRREKPRLRQRAAAGREIVQARFGVDPDVWAANGGNFEASRSLAARYRTLALEGPESEARAAALAAETLARL